jgi:hypothetical protein
MADAPADPSTQITEATEAVRAELARIEAQAATLLALFGAALAVVIAAAQTGLTSSAAAFVWAAALPTGCAVSLLLWAVRPRFAPRLQLDAQRYAAYIERPDDLEAELAASSLGTARAQRLAVLSAHAVAKHRLVRYAIDLLFASLALLAVAAVLVM